MGKKLTDEEYETAAREFERRLNLAREKGEEIRKTLEPELIAQGLKGWRASIEVNSGRYVVGKDHDDAWRKATSEFGPDRLCWGFDIGVPPKVHFGGGFLVRE